MLAAMVIAFFVSASPTRTKLLVDVSVRLSS
jgi:hypothetical protein